MQGTELVLFFEEEWLPKYPYLKFVSTSSVVMDVAHWKDLDLNPDDIIYLSKFLSRYLKECPSRFIHTTMNNFHIVRN